MFDWLLDVGDWFMERFEDIHEMLCGLPGFYGEWYNDHPIIAYTMTIGVMGAAIWWYFIR